MKFKLIIALLDDSKTESIIKAARSVGAMGATIINNARGEGRDAPITFFGLTLETQRDVVLFLVKESLSRHVLESISEVGEFSKIPGSGIAIQVAVEDTVGLEYQIEELMQQTEKESPPVSER